MPHYQVRSVGIAPRGANIDTVARRLAAALLVDAEMRLRREEVRWVVLDGDEVACGLPRSWNEPLDNEYAVGARWAVTRLYPKEGGRLRLGLRRTEARHGFLATYQNERCRCRPCTAANAQAATVFRQRRAAARVKEPRRHGAQCWKYGCYCDERRAADRERQARRRARLVAAREAERQVASAPRPVANGASAALGGVAPDHR